MIGLPLLRSSAQLRSRVKSWRAFGETVALVPLFGPPQAAHAGLMETAAGRADRVLAALVPPVRTPDMDDSTPSPHEPAAARFADEAGADALYAPSPAVFRPAAFATRLRVAGLSEVLAGEDDPACFDAFAADMARLFSQARADVAVFCECQWQRVAIARRISEDFDLVGEIVAAEAERDDRGVPRLIADGEDVARAEAAARLWRVLQRAAGDIAGGADADATLDAAADRLADAGAEVEYLDLRDAVTLDELPAVDPARTARVFGAIELDGARLADSVPLERSAAF
ncbi:MAG: pantoate--beta-alanine ligase [Pseudomonadota bacterium]